MASWGQAKGSACMARLFFLPFIAVVCLSACSTKQFYAKVSPGRIVGNPFVKWEQPNRFELENRGAKAFAFCRSNGEIICPKPIKTDGGSIPRALWNKKGYSPWTYAPGYLIHDWLYEAHRQGKAGGISPKGEPLYYDKEQADWILAEVIKTQMESDLKAHNDPNTGRLAAIYWAVKRFGDKAWNGEPNPVEDSPLTPMIYTAAGNLPLLPTLQTLQSEFMMLPPSAPDKLSGSKTPNKEALKLKTASTEAE